MLVSVASDWMQLPIFWTCILEGFSCSNITLFHVFRGTLVVSPTLQTDTDHALLFPTSHCWRKLVTWINFVLFTAALGLLWGWHTLLSLIYFKVWYVLVFKQTIWSKPLKKNMFDLSSVKMNCLMSKSIQGKHVMKITSIFHFGINHNQNPRPLTNGHECLFPWGRKMTTDFQLLLRSRRRDLYSHSWYVFTE
jgi:hypothetical protein